MPSSSAFRRFGLAELERFLGEMDHVIGQSEMVALSFLVCIERLFGEAARGRVEKRLRAAGRLA